MLAAVRGAVHLDVDGEVVSLTAPGVPLMANAVRVTASPEALARVSAGRLALPLSSGTPVAATRVPPWTGAPVAADPALLRALERRLTGRGPGLTPEGDDVLAGVALALAARGRAADALLLAPADLPARTTSLAGTLRRLAAHGHGPEAAVRLLATGDPAAAAELARLGGSTGAAILRGIAAVLAGDLPPLLSVCRPGAGGSPPLCDIT